jgi:glutamate synthase domain-containing protein 3
MTLDALNYTCYKDLNDAVKALAQKEITIQNVFGQRYLGCALKDKIIIVNGTAGNGTGAYLDGAKIIVNGNAQDAIADTMNGGEIIIFGDCGDTVGYGMRGGEVYIKGNVGYRAGIHMKAYKDDFPVMVIGGSAGSFLGEYQAGGLIIVLGLYDEEKIAGYYCGSGMHGGKIVLRTNKLPDGLSGKVNARIATKDNLKEYENYIKNFCGYFGFNFNEVINHNFYEITPNSKTPYKQLYTYN